MRVEAVIFDMDGLMLDTERLHRTACQQAAAEFGYALSDAVNARQLGCNAADAEQVIIDEFGPAFPIDAYRSRYQELEQAFAGASIPKKRGLDELLALLDSWRVPKAVATSTRRKTAVLQLSEAGLLDRFEVIATGDEVTNGKPAPDLFLLAAQRLGIDSAACLVLEDSERGVAAAHQAGMHVFMIPDLLPPSEIAEKLASGIFDSLTAVARHLDISFSNF